MDKITITVRENGSFGINVDDAARIRLIDHLGNDIAIPPGKSVSLCRCGASGTKPFCDSTHKQLVFRGQLQGPVAIGRAIQPPPPPPAPSPPPAPTEAPAAGG
jgi:CDGSH-type Zn-finger protein